jgi:hypothetical protein
VWVAPALPAFAADAGAFAALGLEYGGMSAVGVAPAQVGLQVAGQGRMAGGVVVGDDEAADRAEVRFDRVAQDASVGVKHNSTLSLLAQVRILSVLLPDQLSTIT